MKPFYPMIYDRLYFYYDYGSKQSFQSLLHRTFSQKSRRFENLELAEIWNLFKNYLFATRAVLMLVKDVVEKCMLIKSLFTAEKYVGEIVYWWICMKMYVGIFTNIQKSFHQHTSPRYIWIFVFTNIQKTLHQHISPTLQHPQREVQAMKTAVMDLLYVETRETLSHIQIPPWDSKQQKIFANWGQGHTKLYHSTCKLDSFYLMVISLRNSSLWSPKSFEEFQNVDFSKMIKSRQIRGGGLWTGIKRFNLTHFYFNNQRFIPKNNLFATKNIFHPIVIGIHTK